jgi:multidrug efflux pump subunit AcrA (membrane-fusion protein)
VSQLLLAPNIDMEEREDESAAFPASDNGALLDVESTTPTCLPDEDVTPPEVAEVIAKLPWWAVRSLLYIVIGFVLVAFTWAGLARIDMVAVANGTIIPQGNIKPIQAASSGVVQSVFVKEGDNVAAGDALIQLDAAEMRTRLDKLRQELETCQAQLRVMMVKGPISDTLEQQNRIARLQTDIAAAEKMLRHTTITSPASGIITSVAVRGSGEVLQPGQTVATVAPGDAPLVVEALLANKDVAFVQKGMPAKLKFEALPFQDYGVVDGTVISISPDAVTDKDHNSYYKVIIAPSTMRIATSGREITLRPGLSASAEIVTEQRTVLSLLFEPARKLETKIVR